MLNIYVKNVLKTKNSSEKEGSNKIEVTTEKHQIIRLIRK